MFWEKFLFLCSEHGISPNAAAKSLSIASGTVTKWKNGATPQNATTKKIADFFGVTVGYLLGNEEQEEQKEKPSEKPKALVVPVYGEIAAGIPIEAIEEVIDYEELPADWEAKGEFIALKIKGDSMAPRILDGDVVIIRIQPDVENGEIAAINIGGDAATLKRVKKTDAGLYLVSNNPAFAPMFFTPAEVRQLPIRIVGKLVELRGKF